MSATTGKLVYMANQIASAFEHQGPEKAIAATYDHIRRFWDPRMRRLIVEHLDTGARGLGPAARGAVARLAQEREPAPATPAGVSSRSAGDAGEV